MCCHRKNMVRSHSLITPSPCFPARSPPQTAPHHPGKARLRSLMQELFSKTSFCHSSISFLAIYNTIIISYRFRNVNSSSSFLQQKSQPLHIQKPAFCNIHLSAFYFCFISAETASNSSTISCSGALVSRETTTMAISAHRNAGSSS